jgi:hypothetical protein
MTQKEIGTIRHLTFNELEIVSGGDGEEIVVTGHREGARSYFYESFSGLDGGGGGFGFGFGYGGESGGGAGITIELDPIDSDGDGTPDESDEAPFDASNNTIVVTAPFSREALDAARVAIQQDRYINDIAGKFFEDPIYYFDRTAELFGADPGLVHRLSEAGLDNRFVYFARQYDANRATAEFFGIVGNEP